MKKPLPFTYYGIDVRPLKPNNMGLRYETSVMSDITHLRADTKEGMKELIRDNLPTHVLRRRKA